MKISKLSNISFLKAQKNLKATKQKIKILNPEQPSEPEKILVIITKNPALYCSGGLELRNITMNPNRNFVQKAYAGANEE